MTQAAPGVWRWQFRIGDKVKTGKTEAKLHLLAIRRVQLRIDRELKKAEQGAQSRRRGRAAVWRRRGLLTAPLRQCLRVHWQSIRSSRRWRAAHGEFDLAARQFAPAFDGAHIGGLGVAIEEVARPIPRLFARQRKSLAQKAIVEPLWAFGVTPSGSQDRADAGPCRNSGPHNDRPNIGAAET